MPIFTYHTTRAAVYVGRTEYHRTVSDTRSGTFGTLSTFTTTTAASHYTSLGSGKLTNIVGTAGTTINFNSFTVGTSTGTNSIQSRGYTISTSATTGVYVATSDTIVVGTVTYSLATLGTLVYPRSTYVSTTQIGSVYSLVSSTTKSTTTSSFQSTHDVDFGTIFEPDYSQRVMLAKSWTIADDFHYLAPSDVFDEIGTGTTFWGYSSTSLSVLPGADSTNTFGITFFPQNNETSIYVNYSVNDFGSTLTLHDVYGQNFPRAESSHTTYGSSLSSDLAETDGNSSFTGAGSGQYSTSSYTYRSLHQTTVHTILGLSNDSQTFGLSTIERISTTGSSGYVAVKPNPSAWNGNETQSFGSTAGRTTYQAAAITVVFNQAGRTYYADREVPWPQTYGENVGSFYGAKIAKPGFQSPFACATNDPVGTNLNLGSIFYPFTAKIRDNVTIPLVYTDGISTTEGDSLYVKTTTSSGVGSTNNYPSSYTTFYDVTSHSYLWASSKLFHTQTVTSTYTSSTSTLTSNITSSGSAPVSLMGSVDTSGMWEYGSARGGFIPLGSSIEAVVPSRYISSAFDQASAAVGVVGAYSTRTASSTTSKNASATTANLSVERLAPAFNIAKDSQYGGGYRSFPRNTGVTVGGFSYYVQS